MAVFKNRASVSFADSFFEGMRKLPFNALKDTNNLIQKFMNDPTSRGLNFETFNAPDPHLRSLRVNGAYRAIVRIPSEDAKNVYTLLWVDAHDAAYDWGKRRRIVINPMNNVVEMFNAIDKDEVVEVFPQATEENKLFDCLEDQDLERLFIRSDYWFLIRAIGGQEDFEKAKQFFPERVYETLAYIAYGFPIEEVIEIVNDNGIKVEGSISIEEAIIADTNRDKFYHADNVADDGELRALLDMSLPEWRMFLHPLQQKFVETDYSGPVRILGGAGTGKTVVAIHRAKRLADQAGKNTKVLYTTFTINLAEDIKASLKEMCTPECFSRIEVINLDKWVYDYCHSNGHQEKIVYGDDVATLWEKALKDQSNEMKLPMGFYMSEYERVILENRVESFDQYKGVKRTGRGTNLNRAQKQAVWEAVESYRRICTDNHVMDMPSAMNRIATELEKEGHQGHYQSILVDEAQDFGALAYRLLRALAGPEHQNDLFIVGDAHQRIYGKQVVFKNCGINIAGRSGILKLNYRSTEEIRKFACAIISDVEVDDMDDGIDDQKHYVSLNRGVPPEIGEFKNVQDENAAIQDYLRKWAALKVDPKSICITARTNKQIDIIRNDLVKNGVKLYEIKQAKGEDQELDVVRIATMHRVKGLEFDNVIIAGANKGVLPLQSAINSAIDAVHKNELITSEKEIVYVAATRARKVLVITCSGKLSELITASPRSVV